MHIALWPIWMELNATRGWIPLLMLTIWIASSQSSKLKEYLVLWSIVYLGVVGVIVKPKEKSLDNVKTIIYENPLPPEVKQTNSAVVVVVSEAGRPMCTCPVVTCSHMWSYPVVFPVSSHVYCAWKRNKCLLVLVQITRPLLNCAIIIIFSNLWY